MAAILDLIETGIAPFDSQTQKTLPNRSESDDPLGNMAIQNSTYHEGCIYDPILGEGDVVGGYRSYQWIGKSDGGLLYALNVTSALSLTIRPLAYLPSNVCDAQINGVRVGHFGLKF